MNKSRRNRILVIGDVMLDHYIHGTCNRISPEAPVPVVDLKSETRVLGGAANVANNIKSLGADVSIFGIIGIDQNAESIKAILKEKNIKDHLIISSNRKTTTKSRVMVNGHQLVRIDTEDRFDLNIREENRMIESIKAVVDEYGMILFSDYNKGVLTGNVLKEVISIAKVHNIKTLVDPKGKDLSKYEGVDIIKANKKEASIASGIDIVDEEALTQACHVIIDKTRCETVIVTLSEDGVAYFKDSELTFLPTKAKEVFDVTGAGDTFLAALSISLADETPICQACEFANFASAVVLGKTGSATVTREEIELLIMKENSNEFIN